MKSKSTLDWLLGEDQPSVRFLTFTQLVERPVDDPEVVAARDMIPRKGWAQEILAKQDPGGWRVLHGWYHERPPLCDREHDARPRAIWLRGSSGGPWGVRVACQESGQERRLELFWKWSEPGLVGGHERLRGISEGEMDRGHEARGRTRGRILPGEGTAQARSGIPAMVPVPLPRPLLLRLARRPRFHDRPGLREGSTIAIRAESPPEEEAAGREVEPRRAPSGRRGRR